MKITLKEIKDLIHKQILREESENAWARFVYELENIETANRLASSDIIDQIVQSKPEDQKEKIRKNLENIRQKTISKILNKYDNLDISSVPAILQAAKQKTEDTGGSYADNVINIARTYWNTQVDRVGTSHHAADPKNRRSGALAVDQVMKSAWSKEAKENTDFWNTFETWHSVGGITGKEGTEFALNFYRSYKDGDNTDELSCYGWSGDAGDSDEGTLNSGVKSIIAKTPGWKNKIHFKMEGDVTFAASHDIITQWLKFKEGDQEFTKSGDLNRLLGTYDIAATDASMMYKFMITGPSDSLLSEQDPYNEIVLDNWEIGDSVVLPDGLSKMFSDEKISNVYQSLHAAAQKTGKKGSYNLDNASGAELVSLYNKSDMSRFRLNGYHLLFYETYNSLKKDEDPDTYFKGENPGSGILMLFKELYEDGLNIFDSKGNLLNKNIKIVYDIRKKMIEAFNSERSEVDKAVMNPYTYGQKYIPQFIKKISEMLSNNFLNLDGSNVRSFIASKLNLKASGIGEDVIGKLWFDMNKDKSYQLARLSYKKQGKTIQIYFDVEKLLDAIETYEQSIPELPDDIKSKTKNPLKGAPPPPKPKEDKFMYWVFKGENKKVMEDNTKTSSASKIAEWLAGGATRSEILVWSAGDPTWLKPDDSKDVQNWRNYLHSKKRWDFAQKINENSEYEKILKELLKI